MRVIDLIPGTIIDGPGSHPDVPQSATYISQTRHPLYPSLQLVVWRLHPSNEISLDALNPGMVLIGTVRAQSAGQLAESLRKALHP